MATWNKIKFFYNTMLGSAGSTLTASSTASGDYSTSYLYNMLETNMWKAFSSSPQQIDYDAGAGYSKSADYLAILGHNLKTISATIDLYWSDDAISWTNVLNAAPSVDTGFLQEFTATAGHRYWRLNIKAGGAGPTSYWKFEETSGITAVDSVGTHTGTLQNGPTRTAGKFGQGITFADNQNVIDCGTDPLFNLGANDFTISVWVKPVSAPASGTSMMVAKGTNSPASGWVWYYYSDGRLCFGAPGIYEYTTSVNVITFGVWQQLTITRISDTITMYKNGVSVFQLYAPGATNYPNSLPLQLGNFTASLAYAMVGVMDSPAIWVGKGLTATEVADLYLKTDLVSAITAPYMTLCIWGNKTELDYASTSFDPYEQTAKANVNLSQGGYVTGVHTQYAERSLSLKFEDADSVLYGKVKTWWETSGLQNFFVAWENANNPDDIWLMRPDPKFSNPLINGGLYRSITINLKGRKE